MHELKPRAIGPFVATMESPFATNRFTATSLDSAQTGIPLNHLFKVTGNPWGITGNLRESPGIEEKCYIMQGDIPRILVMQ